MARFQGSKRSDQKRIRMETMNDYKEVSPYLETTQLGLAQGTAVSVQYYVLVALAIWFSLSRIIIVYTLNNLTSHTSLC